MDGFNGMLIYLENVRESTQKLFNKQIQKVTSYKINTHKKISTSLFARESLVKIHTHTSTHRDRERNHIHSNKK